MTLTPTRINSRKTPPGESARLREEFQARVLAARNGDLRAYAWAVHNMLLDDYQLAWAEAMDTEGRIAIVCPPDTYKSTTVRLYVERAIGLNPSIRILWLMNAGEQSQKQVMTVSMTIKGNQVYRQAFGVEEDTEAQWTKSVLFVRRQYVGPDPTLMATGLNGPYQGLHFDIIITDDVTNQEDVRSPTEMDYQREKIRGVVADRLVHGGKWFAIFTRWGQNDLYDTYEDMGFTLIVMPIVGEYPWGPTISPSRFTEEIIEAKRRDKGEYLFSLTFMCDVEGTGGGIISRNQIGYWTSDTLPKHPLYRFIGVDPASSERTHNDPHAIATVAIDIRTRVKYLVNLITARLEVPQLRTSILHECRRTYGLMGVGVETIGFQLSMIQDLRREALATNQYLPLREIPYTSRRTAMVRACSIDRSKTGRALYLSAQFAAGRLLIPKSLPLFDGISLESELCTYGTPKAKHDDRADAIAFACILADAATPRQARRTKLRTVFS